MFGLYFITWIKSMETWKHKQALARYFQINTKFKFGGWWCSAGDELFFWDSASLVSTENSRCSDNQIGSASFRLREDFGVSLGVNSIGPRTESNFLLLVALPHCVPSPLTQVENFRVLCHQPHFEKHCHAPWP